jgi:glycerol-3-phosphate acyltransferase PlsY
VVVKLLITAIVSYLIGAIPFSLILSKIFKGVDVREAGSGNVGATNALVATGKKRIGLLAGILDLAKAFIAVALFRSLFGSDIFAYTAGLSAIIGHDFSVYIGFKGGKGVASTTGAFIAISPLAIYPAILLFIAILVTTRLAILASVITIISMPFILYMLGEGFLGVVFGLLAAGIAVYTHRNDLERIISGREKTLNEAADQLVV